MRMLNDVGSSTYIAAFLAFMYLLKIIDASHMRCKQFLLKLLSEM